LVGTGALGHNGPMRPPEIFDEPSPAPRTFAEHIYGLKQCLVDRDGRVIASHFPISNGPPLAQAPAMAQILRELVAGVPAARLQRRLSLPATRAIVGR
jgi:hypothetical protein